MFLCVCTFCEVKVSLLKALLRLLTKEISLLEHVDVISSSFIHSTYMHFAFMSLLLKPKTHIASI